MVEKLKRFTTSEGFNRFILAMIILSGVLVGCQTYPAFDESTPVGKAVNLVQNVILWIFVGEIVLKIAACGSRPWDYFRRGLERIRLHHRGGLLPAAGGRKICHRVPPGPPAAHAADGDHAAAAPSAGGSFAEVHSLARLHRHPARSAFLCLCLRRHFRVRQERSASIRQPASVDADVVSGADARGLERRLVHELPTAPTCNTPTNGRDSPSRNTPANACRNRSRVPRCSTS